MSLQEGRELGNSMKVALEGQSLLVPSWLRVNSAKSGSMCLFSIAFQLEYEEVRGKQRIPRKPSPES